MRRSLFVLVLVAVVGCGPGADAPDGGVACQTIGTTPPPKAAARTQCGLVNEYCAAGGGTTPNLACLGTPLTPPAGPAKVTLTGFVHALSNGPDTKGVSIAVYLAAPLLAGTALGAANPVATLSESAIDPTTQRACDVDASKGCTLPSTTGCMTPTCADGLGAHPDMTKYCRTNSAGDTSCNDRSRWEARYSLGNIPTNTQLLIRSSGPGGSPDASWMNLVAWNVYLSTGDHRCTGPTDTDCLDKTDPSNPKYQLNVSALSRADYNNIPNVAGLSGGITEGEGALVGEVRDCDNVRLAHAVVGVTAGCDRFSYFSGNALVPVPDLSLSATEQLGLYLALNLAPGKTHVEAFGSLTDGSPLTTLGSFDAFVYPDTVSIINLNAGKPRP